MSNSIWRALLSVGQTVAWIVLLVFIIKHDILRAILATMLAIALGQLYSHTYLIDKEDDPLEAEKEGSVKDEVDEEESEEDEHFDY